MDKHNVKLSADNLQLTGEIYFPQGESSHPTLCICHGIPARISDTQDKGYPLLAETFCNQGFCVLIFNFRGCGESEGNLDITGWNKDLEAAIDYLYSLGKADKSRLSLLGFSGGAAVSVYRAAQDKRVSAVVTCASPVRFSNITDLERMESLIEQCRQVGTIRDQSFPPSIHEWVRGFEEASPVKWIRQISPRPILIIHGDRDQVCPPDDAWALYHEAKKPKDISIIKGGEHRLRLNDLAMSTALSWLKKVNGLTNA
ncbi:alpha/beta hydrolase [Chloroflexota bacterium]